MLGIVNGGLFCPSEGMDEQARTWAWIVRAIIILWPLLLLTCYHAARIAITAAANFIRRPPPPGVQLSVNLAVEALELAVQICSVSIWDIGELCTTAHDLFQFMHQPPYSIQASAVCCSLSCVRSGESGRGSPDSYASSNGDGGGDVQSSNQHQLHYPLHVHMDSVLVALIAPGSMAQLEDVIRHCEITLGPNYEQALLQAFSDNSDGLSSFFHQLDTPWSLRRSTLATIDSSEFTEESINMCTIMLKINTQLLYLMERKLREQSQPFEELKMGYFWQFAKSPINKLLEIAVFLSEAKWSANHICPMLLAYETVVDVLPVIQNIISSESDDFFSKIIENMREAFRGIFDNIKHFIQYNMVNHEGVTIHPMTCFLVHSLKFFSSHRNLVQSTLAPCEDSNSFGHLLYDVITSWKILLNQHSEVYADLPWRCIFLMNNADHFNRKTDGLLDELLSEKQTSAWHAHESELFENWIKIYLAETLGPVKSCLNHNCWWGSVRLSLVTFTSKLNATLDRQKNWKVPDVVLRQELKDHILDYILSDYRSSLKKCSNSVLLCSSCLSQDILTEEAVLMMVEVIFEG